MKRHWQCVFAVGLVFSALPPASADPPPGDSREAAPAELIDKPFLYEVVRHLYRWYLDETDLEKVVGGDDVVFWIRGLQPKLDENDHSRFGEIYLPQLGLSVNLKKADYRIPELGAEVQNASFMITGVARVTRSARRPAAYREIKASYADMRDDLFRTRHLATFPEGDLLARMRLAVRRELAKESAGGELSVPADKQVVYLSPLSPVANEVWVFWETGRALIRFTSDIDLVNPAVWEHADLAVSYYEVDKQVVVSLDEVAGSNAFLTRDQVGRALYNCIVLGRRLELDPKDVPRETDADN